MKIGGFMPDQSSELRSPITPELIDGIAEQVLKDLMKQRLEDYYIAHDGKLGDMSREAVKIKGLPGKYSTLLSEPIELMYDETALANRSLDLLRERDAETVGRAENYHEMERKLADLESQTQGETPEADQMRQSMESLEKQACEVVETRWGPKRNWAKTGVFSSSLRILSRLDELKKEGTVLETPPLT